MKKYPIREEEYRIQICDHILDNIYGHIGITAVEKAIESRPIFKRLHNISQLGLVNWIFPCAVHTRYTHSIGVMHIAGQMATHINSNCKSPFFSDSDIQIIRLAGLLHDIGHYPLSHNVEQVYLDLEHSNRHQLMSDHVSMHLKEYVNCPDLLNPAYSSLKVTPAERRENFSKSFSGQKKFHHEWVGQQIICHNEDIFFAVKHNFVLLPSIKDGVTEMALNPIFANNGQLEYTEDEVNQITRDLLHAIGSMVVGNYSYNESHEWMSKYSAMIQLIHSELDADNLDYLVRDASFSGTSYGIMDMSVLMNCLTVINLENKTIDVPDAYRHRYLVVVKQKGIGCVEQFLINKYLAYTQMTLSKYVSILEAMLHRVLRDCLEKDRQYKKDKYEKMIMSPTTDEDFLLFTDSHILHMIFNLYSSYETLHPLSKDIISHLVNYSALNLNKSNKECECIFANNSENELKDFISHHEVYTRFLEQYDKICNLTGSDLNRQSEDDERLFAYRFESYSLTKQIPFENFISNYGLEDVSLETQFQLHYYRLGNGIPVIDSTQEYAFQLDSDNNLTKDCLPHLSVDIPQTILYQNAKYKFITLREYIVKQYSSCATA